MNENAKKILIIEDDPHVSKVFQIQLAKVGFNVALAYDGEEALPVLEREKPDLVILDLMIPKKDGFFVLEGIRKNPLFQKIPIIVTSNLGQKNDEVRALELGATEYFIKIDHPIQEIIDKVVSYLK